LSPPAHAAAAAGAGTPKGKGKPPAGADSPAKVTPNGHAGTPAGRAAVQGTGCGPGHRRRADGYVVDRNDPNAVDEVIISSSEGEKDEITSQEGDQISLSISPDPLSEQRHTSVAKAGHTTLQPAAGLTLRATPVPAAAAANQQGQQSGLNRSSATPTGTGALSLNRANGISPGAGRTGGPGTTAKQTVSPTHQPLLPPSVKGLPSPKTWTKRQGLFGSPTRQPQQQVRAQVSPARGRQAQQERQGEQGKERQLTPQPGGAVGDQTSPGSGSPRRSPRLQRKGGQQEGAPAQQQQQQHQQQGDADPDAQVLTLALNLDSSQEHGDEELEPQVQAEEHQQQGAPEKFGCSKCRFSRAGCYKCRPSLDGGQKRARLSASPTRHTTSGKQPRGASVERQQGSGLQQPTRVGTSGATGTAVGNTTVTAPGRGRQYTSQDSKQGPHSSGKPPVAQSLASRLLRSASPAPAAAERSVETRRRQHRSRGGSTPAPAVQQKQQGEVLTSPPSGVMTRKRKMAGVYEGESGTG
jgi:hypothetical protein